jgi:beta-N-acetylhexosaminidase
MKVEVKALPDISSLTLEQKIGQMLMVDFTGYTLEGKILEHLKEVPWGGVILFQKNIKDREQLISLNRQLMDLNKEIPMYISVDQEGGLVNRADFPDMHLSPGNSALGIIDDVELTEKVAFISGVEQRELGFHLNYAPDVDVNINPNNPIIGVRAFGEDPDLVSRHGVAAVKGYEKSGIASCIKHFPGHGDTSFDSHLCLASVSADIDRINKVELPPFQACIEAGTPTVMTAHIIFPALDESKLPATLSHKILTGVLREKMGFDGLIITDSMAMKAIADNFGSGEAAVKTVQAGGDIVMMCGVAKNQLEAYEALINAVNDGKISMEIIDNSVKKILEFKRKYVVNPIPVPNISENERKRTIAEASAKAVTVLYEKKKVFPLSGANKIGDQVNKEVMVLSPNRLYKTLLEENTDEWSIYPYIKDSFSKSKRVIYDIGNPEIESVKQEIKDSTDIVILELYTRGVLDKTSSAFAESVTKIAREKGSDVVFLALSSNYGIPEIADAAITSFNYLTPSLEALSKRMLYNQ